MKKGFLVIRHHNNCLRMGNMNVPKIKFNNAAGYDRMMGVWSQLVGDVFWIG